MQAKSVTRIVVQIVFLALIAGSCSISTLQKDLEERRILEQFRLIEILLPLPPDSIIARYNQYDSTSFYREHFTSLQFAGQLIDSLNAGFPDSLQIDTVAIEHSVERFGEAGRQRKILLLSSAYFTVYDDITILRSVIYHEFGHLAYDTLSTERRREFDSLWVEAGRQALYYLFHDAEYSGNTRFGGHPEDSPAEIFASAFNLLRNQPEEFRSRLLYVDERNRSTVRALASFVLPAPLP